MNNSFFDFKVFLTPETKVSLQGANKKHFLIVVRASDLNDASQTLLSKMMAAAKFDLTTDIAIAALKEGEGINFVQLRKEQEFKHCLGFGLTPQEIGLNFNIRPYQPVHYLACDFLFAHSLEELQTTQAAYKGALWKCLQALFL